MSSHGGSRIVLSSTQPVMTGHCGEVDVVEIGVEGSREGSRSPSFLLRQSGYAAFEWYALPESLGVTLLTC